MSETPKGPNKGSDAGGTPREVPASRGDIATLVTGDRPLVEAPAGPDPLIGSVVLNYRILSKIAEGGMGVVYKAEHVSIGKPVAIKIIKAEYCQNEVTTRRFIQEGRLVNQIRHPNIIDIFDFGKTDDGRAFYVMELLEGDSLAHRVEAGPLSPQEALPLMEQAAEALKAAHAQGIIHRDLKPENLFIIQADGRPQLKLLDFGIAKLVGLEDVQDKLTKTGNIIGTPHYMSPEQINGGEIDARSDVYSLGMVFYEMLSGQVPFGQRPVGQILAAQILGDTGEISQNLMILTIPDGFKSLVRKAIATNPKDRYQSMDALLQDLAAIEAGKAIAPPPRRTSSLQRKQPTSKAAWVALGLGAVILGGLGVWFLLPNEEHKDPPATVKAKELPSIDSLRAQALDLLRRGLRAEDLAVKASCALALGELKDIESRPRLEALLSPSEDLEVRTFAALGLRDLGEPSAVSPLKEARKDAPPRVLVAIDAALFSLGEATARTPLEGHLKQASPEERLLVAQTFARRADPKAAEILASLDLSTLKLPQQFEAISERARFGDDKSRELLLKKLEADSPTERIFAAHAFARIGADVGRDILLDALKTQQGELQILAATGLSYLGDLSGVSPLQEGLSAKEPILRRQAADGLGLTLEEQVVFSLGALFTDQDPQVQISAAKAVLLIVGLGGSLFADQSLAWAEQSLTDQDPNTRIKALQALGNAPAAKALPILQKALSDPDPAVRRAAARAISKLSSKQGSAEAKALLQDLLKGKDPELRAIALVGLAATDAQAKEDLAALLQSDDKKTEDERLAAIEAASEQGEIEALVRSLRDKLFVARFDAALALSKQDISKLTSEQKKEAIEVLKEGLKSSDPATRAQAAVALALLGEPPANAPTAEGLLSSKNPKDRALGLSLLSGLPPEEQKKLIRKALKDSDPAVRLAAVDAAAKIGDLKLLKSALKDPDPAVRAAAIAALESPKTQEAPSSESNPAANPSPADSVCGDGNVTGKEVCDDGNTKSGDGCKKDCSKVEVCGDKVVDAGEECDDGNKKDDDKCSTTCKKLDELSVPEAIKLITKAKSEFEAGQYSKARSIFDLVNRKQKLPDSAFGVAECDRMLGRTSDDPAQKKKYWNLAKSEYDKFTKEFPKDKRVSKAKGFIKEITEDLQNL